jgi:hypothetical protein
MKLSELHKVKVKILEDHKPVYKVKCEICDKEWSLILNEKGTIRYAEWQCPCCYPNKQYIEAMKEIEEIMKGPDGKEDK